MWKLFKLVLTICLTVFPYAHGLNVVSVIIRGFKWYQYETIAPTYDVAFDDANVTFPSLTESVTRRTVFRLGQSNTCDDEAEELHKTLGELLRVLATLDGPTVLLTPGCTLMATTLGDLARELNLPLIISTAGGATFLDKERFPTVLSLGYTDHDSVCEAAVAMLEMYNWTIVSLLCGDLYRFANALTVTACRTLESRLRQQPQTYQVNKIVYDPERTEDLPPMLQSVKFQSRIIFIYFDMNFLEFFLDTATALNMTNGDYVFLLAQSSFFTRANLSRSWAQKPSAKALIIYSNVAPNWQLNSALVDTIIALSHQRYALNTTIPRDLIANALNLAAYQAVICLTMVLNSLFQVSPTFVRLASSPGGRYLHERATEQILQQFRNRTFTLKSGKIFIDASGARRVNVQFMRAYEEYRLGWMYDVESATLSRIMAVADLWPLGASIAPKNSPDCGFRMDGCPSSSALTRLKSVEAVSSVALVLLVGSLLASPFIYRSLRRRKGIMDFSDTWWSLESSQMRNRHAGESERWSNIRQIKDSLVQR
ncbi:hypothetical protein BV898_02556 [Hypsibius exemplaris]|uniref:Receptor ligand binding region domain-containing protein n=1 Tax=Hypsibius exemplaris TaxID=2072580 RepID=A0A1W0X7P6_HYPEX|nr:hypothetical protein BV898_02556 [Hypsibius exemplaris]